MRPGLLTALSALVLVSCAPAAQVQPPDRVQEPAQTTKRVLVVGEQQEPITIQEFVPPGSSGSRGNTETTVYTRRDSTVIAGPANNWSGRNIVGYSNPRVDSILRSLEGTIDGSDRRTLEQRLLTEVIGDVAWMPLYWEVRPVVMLVSVRADIEANNPGWNAFEWRKD